MIELLCIISGYLLGSIPSASLIGHSRGVNFAGDEFDGSLGTSLAFHRLGPLAGIAVGLMDLSKGVAAVLLPGLLGVPLPFVLLSGFAAVCGHDWSIFQSFRGGRGTVTAYGVLAALTLWEFLIALALAGVFYLIYRRPTLATVFLFVILSTILLLQASLNIMPALPHEDGIPSILVIFPLSLLVPKVLKYLQADCNRADTSKPLCRPPR